VPLDIDEVRRLLDVAHEDRLQVLPVMQDDAAKRMDQVLNRLRLIVS
jgi:hypothetical protein